MFIFTDAMIIYFKDIKHSAKTKAPEIDKISTATGFKRNIQTSIASLHKSNKQWH